VSIRPVIGLVLVGGLATVSWGQGVVINHSNCDGNLLSPAVSLLIGQTRSFFAHASVGGNIVDGLNHLHARDAARYPLHVVSDDGTPPAATAAGTLYEYMRGNPGWQSKVTLFEQYIAAGWRSPKITIASNKMCYIDQTADWITYRNSMTALEAANPGVDFIYWTIPLMNTEDSDNRLRNAFNQSLRDWMALPAQSGKFLLDIADIEAWSPAGVQSTFSYGGKTYQKMYDGYTSDGGHLNTAGSDLVAMGLYATYGRIVPEPATIALLVAGGLGLLRARGARGRLTPSTSPRGGRGPC
jgi:hypothetical protein